MFIRAASVGLALWMGSVAGSTCLAQLAPSAAPGIETQAQEAGDRFLKAMLADPFGAFEREASLATWCESYYAGHWEALSDAARSYELDLRYVASARDAKHIASTNSSHSKMRAVVAVSNPNSVGFTILDANQRAVGRFTLAKVEAVWKPISVRRSAKFPGVPEAKARSAREDLVQESRTLENDIRNYGRAMFNQHKSRTGKQGKGATGISVTRQKANAPRQARPELNPADAAQVVSRYIEALGTPAWSQVLHECYSIEAICERGLGADYEALSPAERTHARRCISVFVHWFTKVNAVNDAVAGTTLGQTQVVRQSPTEVVMLADLTNPKMGQSQAEVTLVSTDRGWQIAEFKTNEGSFERMTGIVRQMKGLGLGTSDAVFVMVAAGMDAMSAVKQAGAAQNPRD